LTFINLLVTFVSLIRYIVYGNIRYNERSKTGYTHKSNIVPMKTKKYALGTELQKFEKDMQTAKRQEIMDACNVTRKTVSEWENREIDSPSQMGVNDAIEVARILGCTVQALVNKKQ
jgi:hypothetical protein